MTTASAINWFPDCSQIHISTVAAWEAVQVPGTASGCPALGTQETVYQNDRLVVYPNPSDGNFNLASDYAIEGQLKISTIDGKVVYHKNLDMEKEHRVNVALPQGVYLLAIHGSKTNINKRIFIE